MVNVVGSSPIYLQLGKMGSPFSKAPKTTSFVVNTEDTVSQLRSELFPGGVYPKDAWDRLVAALDQDLGEIRSVCSMHAK